MRLYNTVKHEMSLMTSHNNQIIVEIIVATLHRYRRAWMKTIQGYILLQLAIKLQTYEVTSLLKTG